MLDRQNANLELQNIIKQLKQEPDWIPSAETTLYYINTLIEILPYSSVPQVIDAGAASPSPVAASNVNPETEQERLELLRRVTYYLLENEQSLDFPTTVFDNAFAIEITLSKLFPRNKLLLVDEDGIPYQEEVWEDQIHLHTFTRAATDVIFFSRVGALLKSTVMEYYGPTSASGFDTQGNPRDTNNKILSEREIISINQQGVPLVKRSPAEQVAVIALSNQDYSWGKYIGTQIAKLMMIYFVFYSFAISSQVLLLAGIIVGLVNAISENKNAPLNFFAGMFSVVLTGGILISLSVPILLILVAKSVISMASVAAAFTFLAAIPIPILAPVLVLGFTAYSAHRHSESLAKVLFEGAREIFWKHPIEMFGEFGKDLGHVLHRLYHSIANGVRNLFSPSSPVVNNVHAITIQVGILPEDASPSSASVSSPSSRASSASISNSSRIISLALNARNSAGSDQSLPRQSDDSPEIRQSLEAFLGSRVEDVDSPVLSEDSQSLMRPRSS